MDSATAATPTKKLQYPVMVFFYVEVIVYINILWIPRRVSNDMRKKHSLSWGDEYHYVLSRLGLTSMAIIVHKNRSFFSFSSFAEQISNMRVLHHSTFVLANFINRRFNRDFLITEANTSILTANVNIRICFHSQ